MHWGLSTAVGHLTDWLRWTTNPEAQKAPWVFFTIPLRVFLIIAVVYIFKKFWVLVTKCFWIEPREELQVLSQLCSLLLKDNVLGLCGNILETFKTAQGVLIFNLRIVYDSINVQSHWFFMSRNFKYFVASPGYKFLLRVAYARKRSQAVTSRNVW